ncbi:MAG: response regulator, partial [Pseudomonadota bacterium]
PDDRRPATKPPPFAPCARPLSILLAEDNAINQKVAVRMLQKRGHTVQVANNGMEALRVLGTERFDIILMDVQMPEMDGLQATRAIRRGEEGTGRRTPIVAMTAHAMREDEERCVEAGMDGYVSKPIDPRTLFNTVETLGVGCSGK